MFLEEVCVCVGAVSHRLLFITSHIKIMIKLSPPFFEAFTSFCPPSNSVSPPTCPHITFFFFPFFYLQMEHFRPAGGAAEPLCGAGVPAQRDCGQPAAHGSPEQSVESAAGAPGPTSCFVQAQPAPAERYKHTQAD